MSHSVPVHSLAVKGLHVTYLHLVTSHSALVHDVNDSVRRHNNSGTALGGVFVTFKPAFVNARARNRS